jgi:hypothetical protein
LWSDVGVVMASYSRLVTAAVNPHADSGIEQACHESGVPVRKRNGSE